MIFIFQGQIIILSYYRKTVEMSRSTRICSDEDTVDQLATLSIDHLLNQNRMKDLALQKASNLIELLTIQLQGEKKNHIEALRGIEENLKGSYQRQFQKMEDKIQQLQFELKRVMNQSQNQEKNLRVNSLSRLDSTKSLLRVNKKSLNKKYNQNGKLISFQDQSNKLIEYDLIKQQFYNFQQWKSTILQQLQQLTEQQKNEIIEAINNIAVSQSEVQQIFDQPYQQKVHFQQQMIELIKQQQIIINSLRQYAHELQQLLHNVESKLKFIGSTSPSYWGSIFGDFQDLMVEMKIKLQQNQVQWNQEANHLKSQNIELKNILQGMINLVQKERSIVK